MENNKLSRGNRPAARLFALLALECALLLVLAEGLIAWTNLDNRLLGELLYYQGGDVEVYRASEDIALHYELKPGASAVFPVNRKVTVNSLGFRDPPRRAAKPAGVIRIICLGSSNTYGPQVNNDQTYPARLERLLNKRSPGKYEVWNAGVNAYVIPQTVAAARRILAEYSPDLLIFQMNNGGRRPFLLDQPFKRYFDGDPGLYLENLRFGWPRALNFLRRWRLLRAVVFYVNRLSVSRDYNGYEQDRNTVLSAGSVQSFREFYAENKGKVRMALLTAPEGDWVDRALAPLDIPAIRLAERLPAGHDPDFDKIHPPARVYAWYAAEMLSALERRGLLPAHN